LKSWKLRNQRQTKRSRSNNRTKETKRGSGTRYSFHLISHLDGPNICTQVPRNCTREMNAPTNGPARISGSKPNLRRLFSTFRNAAGVAMQFSQFKTSTQYCTEEGAKQPQPQRISGISCRSAFIRSYFFIQLIFASSLASCVLQRRPPREYRWHFSALLSIAQHGTLVPKSWYA
jgi:hypothetical protein